jgi:hypothetical protein
MSMADEHTPSPLARCAAAVGLALAGMALAIVAIPALRRSDALLRDGVRATATVVSLEDTTCYYSKVRRGKAYPCVKVTGEWIHDALTYRAVIGHHPRPHDFAPGRRLTVVFVPDPAAAAGRADLRFRVFGIDGAEPASERPFYMALLALAGVMCIPLLRIRRHLRFLRRPGSAPRPPSSSG